MKDALAGDVADVKASDRLTESAVCLVASDKGPDRQFERLLSAAGRLDSAAKPILEDGALRSDIAHLLLDTARVLDGERPTDANAFAERLARLMTRGVSKG